MRSALNNGNKIIVLKFGSSVLQSSADLPQAVHEIYRWLRQQYSVVAVVSAFAGETDRLLEQAARYGKVANLGAAARLIATAEDQTCALLALELDRFGVPAAVLDSAQIELRAEGDACDATPISCFAQPITDALGAGQVVIVPGYSGRNAEGEVALLGRGGSDLSAIFLARQLDARCRIIKDVEGIFSADPRTDAQAQCYSEVNWLEAHRVGGQIVQSKALEFAAAAEFSFEVAKIGENGATRVGGFQTRFRDLQPSAPLRVGLLGLGTVGLGVFRELWRRPDLFEVTGIAVRSPGKHKAHAPPHLLTTDCWRVVEDSDLVIEAMGGLDPALDLISAALFADKQVVTANKLLIATAGERLKDFRESGALRFSAAAGGTLPVLETISAIAKIHEIHEVTGVLNGTCNFVLDRIVEGGSFEDAVCAAQQAGFAEADPTLDLDGTDTACKLQLIAQAAFGVPLSLNAITHTGIQGLDCDWIRFIAAGGKRIRLVGSVRREDGLVIAEVKPTIVAGASVAGILREEQNAVTVTTANFSTTLHGKGAGRWPTTVSVMGDVYDCVRTNSIPRTLLQTALGGAA